jgi:hypothetical protein
LGRRGVQYSKNPNYQVSPHPQYFHRHLTEPETETIKMESPPIIQAYIKQKFKLWAKVPKVRSVSTHYTISKIPYYQLDKIFQGFLLEDRPNLSSS